MIPLRQIDVAPVPDTKAELRLMQRGSEFSIMLGQNELMNSRLSGSEQALATLVCRRLQQLEQPRLLIGGLGMGFTLRAALAQLGDRASIVVAELIPAVVTWAHGPMQDVFAGCLADKRVDVRIVDVAELIEAGREAFDAILLDVDNGPEALVRDANNALYDASGLAAAHRALRSGGILAVWSSGPNAQFARRLRDGGFAVEEVKVRAVSKGGGARHVIWLATRRQLAG